MHHCSRPRPRRPWALLPTLAAAVALLAPAGAHATPPGANGPIFGQMSESLDYRLLDPAKDPAGNLDADIWGGGPMLAQLRSSPDGVHVAYIDLDADRIVVADAADGQHPHVLSGTDNAEGLAYSPDGATIAFTRANAVFTLPADGSAAPQKLGGTLAGARDLDWGANDAGLVVSAGGAGGEYDLYAMNPASGQTHPLTQTAGESELDVSFAPDGTKLVVSADPAAAGVDDHLDVMDADGAHRHAIVTEAGATQSQWSPDGTRIAFVTAAGSAGEDVATVAPDGSARHAVANVHAVGLSWPIKPGTGNRVPTAGFTVSPEQPYTGGDTVLTSTAADVDGTIATQEWDLDGDGQYDDATGAVAHVTFATAGSHTVGLRVRDDRGSLAKATKTFNVLVGGRPGAAFTVDPAAPTVGDPATFTAAANADPNAQVVHHQWDFDGDGTWDADTGAQRTVQHTYTATGPVTAKLKVTDAEGDSDVTAVTFTVTDIVRCGTERVGHLVLDGCLVVKGSRRIAPQGVTVNGFHLDATDQAVPAFDVVEQRAASVPAAQAKDVLNAALPVPATGLGTPVSACGEPLGVAPFAIDGFAKDAEMDFTLNPGTTFAGLNARDGSRLVFGNGVAHFDFGGLFPRLLLNWTAEGRGTYAVTPNCDERHVTVRLGSFISRFVAFPEIRLERIGADRWDGTLSMAIKGLPAVNNTKVSVVGGKVRAITFDPGDFDIMTGLRAHGNALTLRLDRGSEELSGRTTVATAPSLFGHDFFAVDGSISLSRQGLKFSGTSKIVGHDIGWATLDVNLDEKYIDAEAEVDFSFGPVKAEASISGYVEPLRLRAEILGHGSAGIDGIGHIGADLFISTKGIAACGHVSLSPFGSVDPGFSWRYGATWPKVFLDSCDFGDLRIARATSATAAAAGVRSVAVAKGQRAVVLVAQGRPGRAPRVAVTGPHGQRITSKANGKATKKGRFLVIPNKQDGTTNILVMKPAGGTWKVRSLGGSTVRRVGSAAALPDPKITVVRRGKALRWTLRRIAGQSVKLVELTADGGRRELKVTNTARGSLRYAPAAGATSIVAEVTQNGLLRETKTVVKLSKTTRK